MNNSVDKYTYWQVGEILDEPVSPQLHLNANTTTLGIAPGYEMHFDGTDNLSPYFGIEAYLMSSRHDNMEFWGPNDLDDVVSQTSTSFGLCTTSRLSTPMVLTFCSVLITTLTTLFTWVLKLV